MTDAERLSGPGLRTFLNIASEWRLTPEETRAILGNPPDFEASQDAARSNRPLQLSNEMLLTISAVLGIYRALEPIVDAGEWLRSPNTSLGGHTPLQLMQRGEALRVRRLVDGWRVG